MKQGRSIVELAQELTRQRDAKRDFLLDTRKMIMDCDDHGSQLTLVNDTTHQNQILGIGEIAHAQIGQALGIPAKYYDKMRRENPGLLAQNVNSWFNTDPKVRMIRTLDGDVRAFLSDRYRRIDNYEIASIVLPIIYDMKGVKIESCEITEQRMYIKVVNTRLTQEVVPGDIVQSGMLITNSEVGLGSMAIQPLVYRLVCTNGMVVNDAATRKYHVGRGNEAGEDYTLYTSATLEADDKALLMKVEDTVRAVVDQTQFDKVVAMMREAKEAKVVTNDIPQLVELAGTDFGFTKTEGQGILDHLIRGGDLSLYGLSNAVTRHAQDVESYDRSTSLESIGYNILSMSADKWRRLNAASRVAA